MLTPAPAEEQQYPLSLRWACSLVNLDVQADLKANRQPKWILNLTAIQVQSATLAQLNPASIVTCTREALKIVYFLIVENVKAQMQPSPTWTVSRQQLFGLLMGIAYDQVQATPSMP